MKLYSPTKYLSKLAKRSIAASSLKLGTHFEVKSGGDLDYVKLFSEDVTKRIEELFDVAKLKLTYRARVVLCTTATYEKLNCLPTDYLGATFLFLVYIYNVTLVFLFTHEW